MKFLEEPVVMIALMVPQIVAPNDMPPVPGWLSAFIMGVFVVLWFLDRIGKLPGRENHDRRNGTFGANDRARLVEMSDRFDAMYKLIAYRDPGDGVERILKYMQEARAAHAATKEMRDDIRRMCENIEELSKKLGSQEDP